MMYKTICLRLLEQRPEIYDQLRQRRTLLAMVNRLAGELKVRHQAWKEELQETRQGSDSQIAMQALELAIQELEDRLSADSEEQVKAFLDAVMTYLRPTPPA